MTGRIAGWHQKTKYIITTANKELHISVKDVQRRELQACIQLKMFCIGATPLTAMVGYIIIDRKECCNV
jgi:hypothetical protein